MMLRNILVAVLLLMGLFSCEDMNYLHKDILDEGEIVYAAKVDSVFTGAGHNRIAFKVHINTQKIEKLRFYWNDRLDSTEMEVGNKTGVFNFMVENLDEREYVFELVSLDMYGNKSLAVEALGRSLGDLYVEGLVERKISNMHIDDQGVLHIDWDMADGNLVKSVITYLKKDGTEATKDVLASDSSIEIADFMEGGEFSQSSYYLPGELSPDMFTPLNALTSVFPKVETEVGQDGV